MREISDYFRSPALVQTTDQLLDYVGRPERKTAIRHRRLGARNYCAVSDQAGKRTLNSIEDPLVSSVTASIVVFKSSDSLWLPVGAQAAA